MHFFGDTEHYTVKRKHKGPCDLCGEVLQIGDRALRWTIKYDMISTIRVHETCDLEAKTLDWYYDDDGWLTQYPLRASRQGYYD
jgi:hypothetical protein